MGTRREKDTLPHDGASCRCYGCSIERRLAGLSEPDRSADPCSPPEACATHGRCWTHSEWIDESACDPLNACVLRGLGLGKCCQVHVHGRAQIPREDRSDET